ncbi:Dolichyl-diphosphooligosaccharide-protein glycosyltransferase subunit dad1 [Cryptotrichosporon argae]
MSLARPSGVQELPAASVFERERARLIEEISANFEDLMTHTNVLNRKLEEIHGVGKDFTTVAQLWGRFSALIREQQGELAAAAEVGVPGTGGANFGASVAR